MTRIKYFTRKWCSLSDHHNREPVKATISENGYIKHGLENGLILQGMIKFTCQEQR